MSEPDDRGQDRGRDRGPGRDQDRARGPDRNRDRSATLIAGYGYVGAALASRLTARGGRVIAIRRRAISAGEAAIETLAVDLADEAALRVCLSEIASASDIDRLVYLASPDGSSEDAYERAYVRGLENVASALSGIGARVERAVLTTSTAVYTQEDGSWVDEDSPVDPRGNARWLLEAEASIARRFPTGVALRLAGIYGPERMRVVRSVVEGSARRPHGPRYANRIHRDDAASAIDHLLALDEPAATYLGVDDDPAELGETLAWIARELELPEPPLEAPDATRVRGGNKRCSNVRLRASGWQPSFPSYRDGYREAIERARSR